MTNGEGPRNISVSRDALRAELAEMELRLRLFLTEQLAIKASAAHVENVDERLVRVERDAVFRDGPLMRQFDAFAKAVNAGELSSSQRRAIEEVVDGRLDARSSRGWTARERAIGLGLALITAATFALNIYLAAGR